MEVQIEGERVVHDVSCIVKSNTVSVLMGPNGSGKSSLVNAIMGHPQYQITKGSVLFDGTDVTKMSTTEKARHGMFLSLQQTPRIGGTTLATFLHMAYKAIHGSNTPVLEFYAHLVDRAEEFGINRTLLDRPLADGLSGGERKQSELLQVLVLQPKIAILDEIDSGVDVDALHTVFRVLDAIKKQGTGCIVISHHPSLLDYLSPESVHVMGNGTIVRSDGKELAEEILTKGFCAVVACVHAETCPGDCGGEK